MNSSGVGFLIGTVFSLSAYALFQDFMGLEGYIAYLQENWVDIHWAVWLAPITLSLAMLYHIMWMERDIYKDMDEMRERIKRLRG